MLTRILVMGGYENEGMDQQKARGVHQRYHLSIYEIRDNSHYVQIIRSVYEHYMHLTN